MRVKENHKSSLKWEGKHIDKRLNIANNTQNCWPTKLECLVGQLKKQGAASLKKIVALSLQLEDYTTLWSYRVHLTSLGL